jgi:hypothetical protein
MHPFMLHSKSHNSIRIPRMITNPPVSLLEPFVYSRPDPSEYSLVELKTLKELGRRTRLPDRAREGGRCSQAPGEAGQVESRDGGEDEGAPIAVGTATAAPADAGADYGPGAKSSSGGCSVVGTLRSVSRGQVPVRMDSVGVVVVAVVYFLG